MIPALAYVVLVLSGAAVVWGIVTTILDKPPGKAQLLFAAGVWLVTLVQSVIAGVWLLAGFRPEAPATLIGYLIGIVLLIPWFWANTERTRYSGLVLAVASLAVLAMTLRLLTLWTAAA